MVPAWPQFMLHDEVSDLYWSLLFERFPEYQFMLVDSETGVTAAVGYSLPLGWDGDVQDLPDEGWDWAMVRGMDDWSRTLTPKVQCALAIVVADGYRGMGLSSRAIRAMQSIGAGKGFTRLLVPARPTRKAAYPLTDIERYIQWRTVDGLPFDPWLRVHVKLGGEIAKPCRRSMKIVGSVPDWEQWTGMQFPETGRYVVPGGLVPVCIERDEDRGTYVEPNVWMCHRLASR
jgi:hypothetical protein